ncbi:MAG: guanylate kinase [Candidatus Omnitrophota bacterium]
MKSQNSKVPIFVISGPSGSGKTTLAELLLKSKQLKNKLIKSVSMTTRPKREEEKRGRAYFFVSRERFKQLNSRKKILEWTRYLGYYYGTPKSFIDKCLAGNRSPVLCLDVKGALRIKKIYPENTVTIFVVPPRIQELRLRIEKRSRLSAGEIRKRLQIAKKEIALRKLYNYRVVNRDLKQASKCLRDIVLSELKA